MNTTDTAAVNVRPAATVLLIDDRPDLQVFMMKRNARTQFAGGMWVFPGGSVDDSDDGAGYRRFCVHRSDEEASRQLGLGSGGLAYYVAAIREAFEEAGVLLALHRGSEAELELLDERDRIRFDDLRDRLNEGRVDFLAVIEQEDLILDAGKIHYVARWITPPGPPRRFDTRFFLSRMPQSQAPIHDDNELVNSAWLSPGDVMARVAAKEMGMLPPTLRMIECLAEFDDSGQAIAAARANLPDERIPMAGRGASGDFMSKAEPGWVRLRRV